MKQLYKQKQKILSWALYDWANSAFPVIVTTFIFAAYFTKKIAVNEILGTHQWGNAIAIAGIFIAIFSPIFGSIADNNGRRKIWLAVFSFLTIISSALLWFAYPDSNYILLTLLLVIVGTIGMEIGMVFYNAMLPSLVPASYLGRISGWAWGLGYLGGLAALILVLIFFVKNPGSWLNEQNWETVRICGPFVGLWFLVFSLPLFVLVPDDSKTNVPLSVAIQQGIRDLARTLKSLRQQKNIFIYLLAHMIYIDGLNTIFAFGGIYAAGTFHMEMSDIIVFGIVMNVAAGVGAILLAWVDDSLGSKPTIQFSLICLSIFALSLVLVKNKTHFWILSTLLCLFVGPVQSASRTLMARLVDKKNGTEMFGLYAFSGKVTTFIGPWILGLATLYFHSQRIGIATVIFFFIIGSVLLSYVQEPTPR